MSKQNTNGLFVEVVPSNLRVYPASVFRLLKNWFALKNYDEIMIITYIYIYT